MKHESAARVEAENQTKREVQKYMELETTTSRVHDELTQQLAHLHSDLEHKVKTISSLEKNLENVSSHLSHTRAQLDELTKHSAEKSENISELKNKVAHLELEIEKDKVNLESLTKSTKDKSDTISSLQQEVEKKEKEVESLESKLRESSGKFSELEKKFSESQSSLDSLKTENKQHQATISEKEIKIAELGAKLDKRVKDSSEKGEEMVKLQHKISEVGNELDEERMAHARSEEKFKFIINSLIIMFAGKFIYYLLFIILLFLSFTPICSLTLLLDIYKRLKWELEGTKGDEQKILPDLASYWTHPPQRDVLKDMEERKKEMEEIIKKIAATRAHTKTEMDTKLMNVTQLLEDEKLARTEVEVR